MRTSSRPGRRVAALGAALTLALALGACGGDDDDAADDTTTTTAAVTTTEGEDPTTTEGDEPTTTTTTEAEDERPDTEEAEALAESINLTLDDFSEGWTEEPATDDGDDELDPCFPEIDFDEIEIASADSPTFSIESDDGSQAQVVQTSTIVLDEPDSAEAVVDAVPTNQFAGCAEDALIASFAEDGTDLTSSGFEPVPDQGGLGEGAAGVSGAISFAGPDGTEYSGQLAFYFVRTENVVTGVSILDIGDLAFEDTLADLLAEISTRQADELG